jgi:adenylosuccinate synthase
MKAIVTVGLGFGDEGKGATVDALARDGGADLVVRYSGGAQAGHNVQLPDGRRHTFSQFGAGTLAGVRTWVGPRVILCPSTLGPEAEHLRAMGVADPFSLLEAHPACLVSTVYHL